MTHIRAIVFDFDGTLMDTEACAYEAFQSVYAEHGQELPLERWALCIGMVGGPFDPYDELSEKVGRPLDRAMLERRFEEEHESRLSVCSLRPGVVEALEEAQRLGLRIGLASSSDRVWIERHLASQGIRRYFEVIRTRDDVVRAKPDPALYIQAAQALEVRPDEAVAVEDSLNGLRAAVAAGLRSIVVPNPQTAHMDFSAADLVIRSLADEPLSRVLERLAVGQESRAAER